MGRGGTELDLIIDRQARPSELVSKKIKRLYSEQEKKVTPSPSISPLRKPRRGSHGSRHSPPEPTMASRPMNLQLGLAKERGSRSANLPRVCTCVLSSPLRRPAVGTTFTSSGYFRWARKQKVKESKPKPFAFRLSYPSEGGVWGMGQGGRALAGGPEQPSKQKLP